MEDLKFEDAIRELENVANELEKGELSLDKSVEKFKQGMELASRCNKLLSEAEKSITVLIEDSNGEVEEKPFKLEND